jgi:hypothetical protein
LRLYEAVLTARDTASGKSSALLFMDTRVLTPAEIRADEQQTPKADRLQPLQVLDSLLARHLIGGICEPVDASIRGQCVHRVNRPVLSLSEPTRKRGDTVTVSVLYYTVATPEDSLSRMLAFAVEEEFTLQRSTTGWAVIARRRTMIT